MSKATQSAAKQAQLGDPSLEYNWIETGDQRAGEIMELATRNVWLSHKPLTREQYEALKLPEGFIKSGIGCASMDLAYFRRSPNAKQDGPLDTMEVDGRLFVRVARPGQIESTQDGKAYDGLMIMHVDKHHSLLFKAGRTIEVMSFADGRDYVPVMHDSAIGIPGASRDNKRQLPEGWTVREIQLKHDLLVHLPTPTRAAFFLSAESFQGPVRLNL